MARKYSKKDNRRFRVYVQEALLNYSEGADTKLKELLKECREKYNIETYGGPFIATIFEYEGIEGWKKYYYVNMKIKGKIEGLRKTMKCLRKKLSWNDINAEFKVINDFASSS